MINDCPKCGYIRKPSDSAPSTECPSCGLIFAKFLAAPARKASSSIKVTAATVTAPVAAKQPKLAKPSVPSAASAVTTCPACGGVVAYGAKTCPHCGKAKPAPKPPTKVSKTHLALAALFLGAMFLSLSNNRPGMTAEQVTKLCSKEAGFDPDSSRSMTMKDIRIIDACVNRYGFKTKP